MVKERLREFKLGVPFTSNFFYFVLKILTLDVYEINKLILLLKATRINKKWKVTVTTKPWNPYRVG